MSSGGTFRTRKVLTLLVGLAVSSIFIYLLLGKLDIRQVVTEIRRVRVGILLLTIPCGLLGFLAMASRSAVLLQPIAALPLPTLFKSVMVSFAGNNVLPFRMGELLRVDYLARRGRVSHSACLAVLTVERLLDVACLVILFFALVTQVISLPSAPSLALLAVVVSVALAALTVMARRPDVFLELLGWGIGWTGERASGWIVGQARRFTDGLSSLGSIRRVLWAAFFSACYWAAMMLGVRIVLWAFAIEVPWFAPAVVLVFGAFGAMLPSTPAFIGTFHYFSSLALTTLGVDATRAASFAIVQHAMGVVPLTLLSIAVLFGEFSWRDVTSSKR